jgi:hypothetical protein
MSSQRVLLIGGVALVKGRVRDAGAIMVEICDAWEPILRSKGFVKDAPFNTVSLVIRFGEKESAEAELARIDGRNKELPVSYELPMAVLRSADRATVKGFFSKATEKALERVAEKYDLPSPESMLNGANYSDDL